MPLLFGFVAGLFAKIFEIFATRLSFNLAFGAAMLVTYAAAFAAFKAALAAIWLAVPIVTPPLVTAAFALVLPGNTGSCIAAIIATDVIATSWNFWRDMAKLAAAPAHFH